jgi:hypothetical protein
LKYLLIISFLTIGIISNGQSQNFPTVLSIKKNKTVEREFNESKQWFREVKYIGLRKDTLFLSEDNYSVIENNEIPAETARRLYYYNFDCDNCINIEVDTNQILPLSTVEWKRNNLFEEFYKSYPVIIENKSDSLYKIGFGLNVRVIVEALDIDNLWKAIEIPYMYKCGTGLEDLYLQSHQIACILIPKYKGEFRTQLRLRLNENLSKPFWGSINRKQFKKRKIEF